MHSINLEIKRSFFDRKRKLVISNDFILFDESDLLDAPFTRFEKDEITAFRYGVRWLRGVYFYVGREYQFFIQNKDHKILKIHFKTYYGLRKNELNKLYFKIFEVLWKLYFNEHANNYLSKFFRHGESIEISGVLISKDGITIKASGIYKNQAVMIHWEKVKTADYQTYFNIHSSDDPVNITRTFSYLEEWNTMVLNSVVRAILRHKNLLVKEPIPEVKLRKV